MTPLQFKISRLATGMTQKEFGAWLYTSDRRVRAWEKGEARIPGSAIRCLELWKAGGFTFISKYVDIKSINNGIKVKERTDLPILFMPKD
jgi:hypothetical protein